MRTSPRDRRVNLILLAILLLGLVLRLAYLSEFRQTPFFDPRPLVGLDQRTWDENGAMTAEHPWFVDGHPFYQAPGYAYFLALVYRLFGLHNYLAAGVVQALLDVLAVFLIFLLGERLWNRRTGLIAAGLYAFYRPFIFYAVTLLSDSFILFTSVLCLFLVYRTLERPEKEIRWLWAGLGFGLATITKPTILVFALLSLLLVLVGPVKDIFRSFRFSKPLPPGGGAAINKLLPPGGGAIPLKSLPLRGEGEGGGVSLRGRSGGIGNPIFPGFLFFLLGFLLLVSPVVIRNTLYAGKFVTVATYGSVNWQIGNSSDSIGLFMYPKGALLSPVSAAFWKLWGKKVFFFFSSYEWPQNLNIYLLTFITRTLKLPLFAFGFVVPLGLAGFFVAAGAKCRYLQAYVLAGVVTIVAFFVTSRYRLPAVAGFILLAAGYLDFLYLKIMSLRASLARQSHPTKSLPLEGGGKVGVNAVSRANAPSSRRGGKEPVGEGWSIFCNPSPQRGEGGVRGNNETRSRKDLAVVVSSLFAVALVSFVWINSWSGPRIGEVHARYYALAAEKSAAADRAAGRSDLAAKKLEDLDRFLRSYQSGQTP